MMPQRSHPCTQGRPKAGDEMLGLLNSHPCTQGTAACLRPAATLPLLTPAHRGLPRACDPQLHTHFSPLHTGDCLVSCLDMVTSFFLTPVRRGYRADSGAILVCTFLTPVHRGLPGSCQISCQKLASHPLYAGATRGWAANASPSCCVSFLAFRLETYHTKMVQPPHYADKICALPRASSSA